MRVRRRLPASAARVAAIWVVTALAAGCGGSGPSAAPSTTTPAASLATEAGVTEPGVADSIVRTTDPVVPPTTPETAATMESAEPTTSSDPGLLPQTPDIPDFGAPLEARLRLLWTAITTESPPDAVTAFFPRAAYIQLKNLKPNAAGVDFDTRLMSQFLSDVATFHRAIGPGVETAEFVSVNAQPAFARWITPRACQNRLGYWHVPGVRIVYRLNGNLYSIRVTSLIAWRGQWYVVHLGDHSVPRSTPKYLDAFSGRKVGPGKPGPAGGC